MARTVVGGFLSIFGGRVAMFAVTFLSTPILVRVLGGAGAYGDYKFLMSGFAVLMILVSSGVTDGVQKFVSERRSLPDWQSHVVGFYVRSAAVLAALGAAALVVAAQSDLLAGRLSPGLHTDLLWLAALVVTAQFRSLAERVLRGLSLEQYSEPLRVLDTVVWAAGGIGLAAFGLGVTGVVVAHVVGAFLVAAVGFALVSREVSLGAVLRRTPERFPTRSLLSFNALSVVLVLFVTSLYKLDVLMIRWFLGSDATGQYAAALALAEHLWFVPLSLQAVLIHSTSELWSRGEHERLEALVSRTTRYTLLLTTLLAVGLAALAPLFIPLYYGPGFEGAVTPLLVLLPGAVALAVARPIFAVSQGIGDLRPVVLSTFVAAAVNAGLNYYLIPRYGVVGAAVATTVGYASMLPLQVASARVVGFHPLSDLRPLRVLATGVLTGVAVFAAADALTRPFVAFAVVPLVGASVFLAVAVVTRALTLDELLGVLSTFPDPVGAGATRLRGRVGAVDTSVVSGSRLLTVAGVVFLVAGVALSVPGAVPGGVAGVNPVSNPHAGNASGTTHPDVTTTPTTTTGTPTGTPADGDPTATSTKTPTATTTTADGGGGGSGGGGGGDSGGSSGGGGSSSDDGGSGSGGGGDSGGSSGGSSSDDGGSGSGGGGDSGGSSGGSSSDDSTTTTSDSTTTSTTTAAPTTTTSTSTTTADTTTSTTTAAPATTTSTSTSTSTTTADNTTSTTTIDNTSTTTDNTTSTTTTDNTTSTTSTTTDNTTTSSTSTTTDNTTSTTTTDNTSTTTTTSTTTLTTTTTADNTTSSTTSTTTNSTA